MAAWSAPEPALRCQKPPGICESKTWDGTHLFNHTVRVHHPARARREHRTASDAGLHRSKDSWDAGNRAGGQSTAVCESAATCYAYGGTGISNGWRTKPREPGQEQSPTLQLKQEVVTQSDRKITFAQTWTPEAGSSSKG